MTSRTPTSWRGITLPPTLVAAHDKNAVEAIAAIDFAVLGHSLGGEIAFYAAALDRRIDHVIAWHPSNAGRSTVRVVFRAAPDGTNPEPAHNAVLFYRGAPAPATLLDFGTHVRHGDFANPGRARDPSH